ARAHVPEAGRVHGEVHAAGLRAELRSAGGDHDGRASELVGSVLDQPAVVLLAAAASVVFLLLEVALPTVGLAGSTGLALCALAVWGIHRQDADWWPLLGVAAAVVVWGVLIAMHRRTTSGQMTAAALFLV